MINYTGVVVEIENDSPMGIRRDVGTDEVTVSLDNGEIVTLLCDGGEYKLHDDVVLLLCHANEVTDGDSDAQTETGTDV